MTKLIKNENNVYKLITKNKVKQKYCFDFYLCNDVDKKTLGIYFELKQKYAWLLQKQRYKKLESHIYIDLNHLSLRNKVSSSSSNFKWTTTFSFLDYNLEKKISNINEFILDFFKPTNFERLNKENTKILIRYLYDMINSTNQKILPIKKEKNNDNNQIFDNYYFLLNSLGFNNELSDFSSNDKIEHYLQIFTTLESNIHNKINSYKSYFRISNPNYCNDITNYMHNWKINCSDSYEQTKILKEKSKNYFFKDEVSSSSYFMFKNQENNMRNRLFASYFYNISWNYYFENIREKMNIIYSPSIRIESFNPLIIKVDNQTQNENLPQLIMAEKRILQKIKSKINEKSILQFKKTIANALLENIENESVEFYSNIYQYFEKDLSSEITTIQLEELYQKIVDELTLVNILNYVDDIIITNQSYTFGDKNDSKMI